MTGRAVRGAGAWSQYADVDLGEFAGAKAGTRVVAIQDSTGVAGRIHICAPRMCGPVGCQSSLPAVSDGSISSQQCWIAATLELHVSAELGPITMQNSNSAKSMPPPPNTHTPSPLPSFL